MAAILSFLLPGVGQLYNGQAGRGAIAMLVWVAWVTVAVALTIVTIGLFVLLAIPIELLFHAVVAYDAYDQAEKINQGVVRP